MLNILFLCTGNSCRSQMAEGIARHLGAGRVNATSAGSRPAGFVHPAAIAAMHEIGIDISRHHSKPIDDGALTAADIVITVCGGAAESCPVTPPGVRRLHWDLPDPAQKKGTAEEVAAEFRRSRDEIRRRVETLLKETAHV